MFALVSPWHIDMKLRKLRLAKLFTRTGIACACFAIGIAIITLSLLEINNTYIDVKHEYNLANHVSVVVNGVGYKKPSPALTLSSFKALITNNESSVVK